jgi:DNA-binding response OmpR family regulator
MPRWILAAVAALAAAGLVAAAAAPAAKHPQRAAFRHVLAAKLGAQLDKPAGDVLAALKAAPKPAKPGTKPTRAQRRARRAAAVDGEDARRRTRAGHRRRAGAGQAAPRLARRGRLADPRAGGQTREQGVDRVPAHPLILVVDDEPAILVALERALRLEGFGVRTAATGEAALAAAAAEPPAAIVLDVVLPDADGREIATRLRASGLDTPICILSARDQVADRVAGLQAGADDYLVKPFAMEELVARLHALLRRGAPAGTGAALTAGNLRLDPARRLASRGSVALDLTRREFDLLEAFMRHPGLVLTRTQLLGQVWGYDWEADGNVVDVFVGYLRRKLGEPRVIHTVRGVGFVLR